MTLEGERTADGFSMKPETPAARVEAGEPRLPLPVEEPAEEDPSPEGML